MSISASIICQNLTIAVNDYLKRNINVWCQRQTSKSDDYVKRQTQTAISVSLKHERQTSKCSLLLRQTLTLKVKL